MVFERDAFEANTLEENAPARYGYGGRTSVSRRDEAGIRGVVTPLERRRAG